MKKSTICLKFGKLYERENPGSYVFSSKRRDYFYEKFTHSLFLVDSSKDPSAKEGGNIFFAFEHFYTKGAYTLSHTTLANKPSFMIINGMLTSEMLNAWLSYGYRRLEDEKDFTLLTVSQSYYITYEQDDKDALIEKLFSVRNNPRNDVYIIVDSLEEVGIKNMAKYIKEAADKRVYFILLVVDEEKLKQVYSEEDVKTIYDNCLLKYTCSKDKILAVECHNPRAKKQVDRIKLKKSYY